MRKTLTFILLVLAATSAFAQRTPRVSPNATLTQTVGIVDITLKYSRPGVKGRQIWGGLVPYDKVWRTGANEATTISFSDDVSIGGQTLKKGTYALFTIPGASEWKVVFNSQAEQWGAFTHDTTKDVVTVTAKPEKADFREWMMFEIPKLTTDEATIVLRWENVAVPFTVNTDSTKKTMATLRNGLKPSWQAPYTAASFAFENSAATPEEINGWLADSLKIQENTTNLWLKARMQQKAGQTAEARKTADLAISKATEAQKDFVVEIQRQVAGWK
jgi:hypothetical protein